MPRKKSSLAMPASLPKVMPFGLRLEDMDIDFSSNARANTAVSLVAALSLDTENKAYDEDWARSLPLSARLYQLLRIVQASTDSEGLELTLKEKRAERETGGWELPPVCELDWTRLCLLNKNHEQSISQRALAPVIPGSETGASAQTASYRQRPGEHPP